MNDDELQRLLRAAVCPTTPRSPSRDLWPLILERGRAPAGWSWLDVGVATMVAILLLLRPSWILLLAYHL
jgi:hypothetical protein